VTVGDMGYQDEDGYLYLCDRKRDMIISGGVNIYPAEIESVLIQMPGVRDCAVFGIPDEEFGEQICAHVEPLPGAALDAASVRSFLGQHVARYKVPKVVELNASLPREDSGKIFKRKLRNPYWEKAGRSI
jgi:long-chain acyl-CoA synthetase